MVGRGQHREEISSWFVEAPLPFRSKVRLYEAVTKDSDLIRQFGDLAAQMRESYDFRNTLAHSFRHSGSLRTSRGVEGPAERVSLEVLQDKLERLAHLDDLLLHLLGWEIEDPPEPVFTDDSVEWPFGVFLPLNQA